MCRTGGVSGCIFTVEGNLHKEHPADSNLWSAGCVALQAISYTVTAQRKAYNKHRAGRPIFVVRLGFQKRQHMAVGTADLFDGDALDEPGDVQDLGGSQGLTLGDHQVALIVVDGAFEDAELAGQDGGLGSLDGLSSALGAAGVKTRVLTAVRMEPIGEFYSKWKAIEAMENGEVVIMSAGTGNPFFTTDTGSSLRGIEIEADVMLKGTRVDGIYTADPEKDPTATKFDDITYDEVLSRGLKVMDLTATCMCKENKLPIIVFDMDTVGNLKKVMSGENIGTLVHP